MRQYEELRQRLHEELGLEPDIQTTELYAAIKARQKPAPAASHAFSPDGLHAPDSLSPLGPGPLHNLPAQHSIFIGRKKELKEVLTLLAAEPGSRLVTIVGPGGIGKTRLALEASYGVLRSFTDGICFVSLASLTSPEHIVPTLMDNLGLRFYDEQIAENYLLNFLHKKRMLLVLDNVEHLLAGMDLVARILQAAPAVKVLVTSRERLNLTGEMVFSLGAMDYPEIDNEDDIQEHGAVQLLIHYARLARPDLVLDDQALKGILQICRLV